MKNATTCVIGTALLTALGCSSSTDVDCSTVDPFPYSILVTVVFPEGMLGPIPEPEGVVTGSGTTQAMMALQDGRLASTVPVGAYEAQVTAEGFEPWTATGISTRAGVCGGFVPVELTAELDRAP